MEMLVFFISCLKVLIIKKLKLIFLAGEIKIIYFLIKNMSNPTKNNADAYYYELDSLNEEGAPIRRSVAERKERERHEKSILIFVYNKFKDYISEIQDEVQQEKEKFQPLLILWFFGSLFVDTLLFSRWLFVFSVIYDGLVLFIGLKGVNDKNNLYLYSFIGVLLGNTAIRFYVALRRLWNGSLDLVPTCLDLLLLCYEFLILYLIIKVEWLVRKAQSINRHIPRPSEYEKPIIDEFDLISRKNTISSSV